MSELDSAAVAATERWFLRRGLPHFIRGYAARTDIWTRAAPLLSIVFVAETLGALRGDWSWWQNLLALGGALALLVGVWALVNRLRGRPLLARPDDVGGWELAAFVVGPALVPLVIGGQEGTALATLLANLVLLAVVYLATSYGLVPMTRWGFGQLGRQSADVVATVVRALPLLLLFVTFLFVNAEAWQVNASLPWWSVAVLGGLFFVLGTTFAALRLPRQIGELSTTSSWDEVTSLCAGTPVQGVCTSARAPDTRAPLTRRQWGNVGLVVLVSEGVQILLVTIGVLVFFTVFGFVAIDGGVIGTWTGAEPTDVIAALDLGGRRMVLTEELLKVATFLAAFSGLYYTVSLLTDATFRAEFLEEVVGEVRQAFAVRDVYLAAAPTDSPTRGSEPGAGGTDPSSTLPTT